ncbi:hypothetical protein [Haladaptatus sp. DYSN1]|uniref:hypothetical protein n=1 Tax=unclassified Haladaptatus TaxID=2622732 RepID=UPI002406B545|nr:hypothetical protein [Haladaptatus sp. DYSN1]
MSEATRLSVSVPEPVSSWVLDELQSDAYTGYLRRVHAGPVGQGTEWEEFVSRGCGLPKTVVLRVETVTGGDEVGRATTFEFTRRA